MMMMLMMIAIDVVSHAYGIYDIQYCASFKHFFMHRLTPAPLKVQLLIHTFPGPETKTLFLKGNHIHVPTGQHIIQASIFPGARLSGSVMLIMNFSLPTFHMGWNICWCSKEHLLANDMLESFEEVESLLAKSHLVGQPWSATLHCKVRVRLSFNKS